jgi:serine-type D-Ala-D-Ala carboxypeptidase (penicillin-binding protein 5/6)
VLPLRPTSADIQLVTQKLLMENPAPFTSALSWVILDRKKGTTLFGKQETTGRQIASLTKIMTAHCALNLTEIGAEKKSPFADLEWQVKVLKPVSQMEGTSARLLEGDSVSIKDLLYGMMLPSGNDAAQALAIHFGSLILNKFKSDPNKDLLLSPDEVTRKCKELKIQTAFEFCKNKIL